MWVIALITFVGCDVHKKKKPDYLASWLALIDQGRSDQVENDLTKIEEDGTIPISALNHVRGYIFEHKGALDSARSLYERNITDPESDELLTGMALGRVCFKLRDYNSSYNYLLRVARADSCYDWVQYRLCSAMENLGQPGVAKVHCERQLLCTPEDTASLLKLAQLELDLDEYYQARSDARRYLRQRYSDDAILVLAEVEASVRGLEEALAIVDSVMLARGESAALLSRRAYVLSGFGETAAVKAFLNQALARDSGDVLALKLVDMLYDDGELSPKDSLWSFVRH